MFDRMLLVFIAVTSFFILMYTIENVTYTEQLYKKNYKQTELDAWFKEKGFTQDKGLLYFEDNDLPPGVYGE